MQIDTFQYYRNNDYREYVRYSGGPLIRAVMKRIHHENYYAARSTPTGTVSNLYRIVRLLVEAGAELSPEDKKN